MEVIVVEEEREAGGAVEAGVVMHRIVFRDSPRQAGEVDFARDGQVIAQRSERPSRDWHEDTCFFGSSATLARRHAHGVCQLKWVQTLKIPRRRSAGRCDGFFAAWS